MTKLIALTPEQRDTLEQVRDQIKSSGDSDYIRGVVDALAFVWAGIPSDGSTLYRGTNSAFAHLLNEAGF